jgi:pyruvate,water dikinase
VSTWKRHAIEGRGRVRQVLTVQDMASFKSSEILVAFMSDVGIVPVMRRAAAIFTDVGSVTCHAGLVAA